MGAAGVRIEVNDESAYSTTTPPSAIAGIVGFSAKGELNKILKVNTVSDMDTILGYGYNNPKFNQGLYAARAVVTSGGRVEFVRPYGETIDKSSDYLRDLKSDAFVVTYDRNAYLYEDRETRDSLQMKNFASTRYKTDAGAEFGLSRKINNISETVVNGNNVDFGLSAGDEFQDSKYCRKYAEGKLPTDTVLFAVVNSDPSSANRAYTKFDVTNVETSVTDGSLTLTLATRPGFTEGETVYLPVSNGGTSSSFTSATVTAVKDFDVTVQPDDPTYLTNLNRPNALFYCSDVTAVSDGFDYLTVKTAVAGRGVKVFTALQVGNFEAGSEYHINELPNGTCIIVYDSNQVGIPIRILNGNATEIGITASDLTETPDGFMDIHIANTDIKLIAGDVIALQYSSSNVTDDVITFTVVSVGENSVRCLPNGDFADSTPVGSLTITKSYILSYSEDIDYITADITTAETWTDVTTVIAKAFRSASLGYRNNAIVNNISDFDVDAKTVTMDPSAAIEYSIGDTVAFILGSDSIQVKGDETETTSEKISAFIRQFYDTKKCVFGNAKVTAINPMTGVVTLDSFPVTIKKDSDGNSEFSYKLLDLSSAAMTVYSSGHTVFGDIETGFVGKEESAVDTNFTKVTLDAGEMDDFLKTIKEGSTVSVYDGDSSTYIANDPYVTTVRSVNEESKEVVLYDPNGKLRGEGVVYWMTVRKTVDFGSIMAIGSYSLYVAADQQNDSPIGTSETDKLLVTDKYVHLITDTDSYLKARSGTHFVVYGGMNYDGTNYIVEKSDKVLADSGIGETFLSLGLAATRYEDVDFSGEPRQVYVLNSDGETVARLFLGIQYRFNGTVYEFEGTIVPYKFNNTQLSIKDAAYYELTDSGVSFLLNESGVLDAFLDNNAFDLSQTIKAGSLDGTATCISFNPEDPAIMNDAVWSYSPTANWNTSTMMSVWNLFLDKDGSDVSFLVSAGMNINNFGMKNIETLNPQVMSAMLTVCEARKDCFALFGGIGEAKIGTALKKYSAVTGFPTTLGRWGAIYDGRGIMNDTIYTLSNVDVDKSVQIAALVSANRTGSIFWYPPAGKKKGIVPSAWGAIEKFPRRFSYPEDMESDIAKLSNIHVNATRSTSEGNYFWGDFTLQMEDTAFNQIHVAMLMAGIHKMYYHYLDEYVFSINDPQTRSDIQTTIQASLDAIKNQKPSGFYSAECICDETNNPPSVVAQNKLYVDIRVRPTKTARYIYLRSTVLPTENGNQITTTLA